MVDVAMEMDTDGDTNGCVDRQQTHTHTHTHTHTEACKGPTLIDKYYTHTPNAFTHTRSGPAVCDSLFDATFFPDKFYFSLDFGLEAASSQTGGICHEEEDFDPLQHFFFFFCGFLTVRSPSCSSDVITRRQKTEAAV